MIDDRGYRRAAWAWIALLALLLGGCSTGTVREPAAEKRVPVPGEMRETSYGWWQACFRMPFDENGEPRWAVDHLLAHRVAAPLLAARAGEIGLWRFHRRAGRDSAGHQFSVIFYSGAETAASFFRDMDASPVVADLIESGYMKEVVKNCRGEELAALDATSDPAWDSRLQTSWPYFIMGVSAHWLSLIEEIEREMPAGTDEVPALLDRYGQVQDEISEIWRIQGQHAYLHHLNAIFGYQPMFIRKDMRF